MCGVVHYYCVVDGGFVVVPAFELGVWSTKASTREGAFNEQIGQCTGYTPIAKRGDDFGPCDGTIAIGTVGAFLTRPSLRICRSVGENIGIEIPTVRAFRSHGPFGVWISPITVPTHDSFASVKGE